MNTKKLDRAWPIFEEISKEKFDSHCVSIGYAIGGALPMEKETMDWQEQIQRLTSQPLADHPDPSLSAEEYGKVLRAKGIVPGVDGEWFQFDMVPGEKDIRRGTAEVTGRLCVIGSQLREDEIREVFHLT